LIYILDTYFWIEYFFGRLNSSVNRTISKSKIITMECSLGELSSYCTRKGLDYNKCYRIIRKKSIILPVLREHWVSAGKLKPEMRKDRQGFGLIDAILLAKQQELKCRLVTGDPHFKGLKNIMFLGA